MTNPDRLTEHLRSRADVTDQPSFDDMLRVFRDADGAQDALDQLGIETNDGGLPECPRCSASMLKVEPDGWQCEEPDCLYRAPDGAFYEDSEGEL
jgi:hypothetical protein